jgi:hypothetical protein
MKLDNGEREEKDSAETPLAKGAQGKQRAQRKRREEKKPKTHPQKTRGTRGGKRDPSTAWHPHLREVRGKQKAAATKVRASVRGEEEVGMLL